MLLIVWRMLVGSAKEQRQERVFQHKMTGAEFARADSADDYAGMQLRICARPCQPALQMHGQSFLRDDVPSLPLAGCDRTCLCYLDACDDRRASDERRLPQEDMVTFREQPKEDNSRAGRDRRRRRHAANTYGELSR
jgi:hypothetical protein